VPREQIVAGGLPKDGLPALNDPAVWSVERVREESRGRRKLLVAGDKVLGVSRGGATRAYPLRLLVWHEVVNDTLGGEPIAVTYNPLSDCAAAFVRRIGDETLSFGVSGLLYESNLLVYDRRPEGSGESLWSQVAAKAVAGLAAARGATLAALPITVTTWQRWSEQHPSGEVLAPDPRMTERYASDPYSSYFGSDELRFPVAPLSPTGRFARKTPVVAIGQGGRWLAFPFPVVAGVHPADLGAAAPVAAAPVAAALRYSASGPTVEVAIDRLPPGSSVMYASLFAWWATHQTDTTWVGGPP
jgi:hypothetical protein